MAYLAANLHWQFTGAFQCLMTKIVNMAMNQQALKKGKILKSAVSVHPCNCVMMDDSLRLLHSILSDSIV